MPNRPTREFWKKTYPEVRKHARSAESARKITGDIWYHKMSPAEKRKYENIRRRRER